MGQLSTESLNEMQEASGGAEDSSTSDHKASNSASGSGTKRSEDEQSSEAFELAKGETQLIFYSKLLLIGLIAIITTALGYATFRIIRAQETSNFESKFSGVADEIQTYVQLKAVRAYDTLERFSASMTSTALALDQKWPFVTIPDFEVRGMLLNKDTGAYTVSINPLVYPKYLEDWGKFAVSNQSWMAEGHKHRVTHHKELYQHEYHEIATYKVKAGALWNATGITPFVWKYGDENKTTRVPVSESLVYAPVWQVSPAEDYSPSVNQDINSAHGLARFIDGMIMTDQAVITGVTDGTILGQHYDAFFDPDEQYEPHSYFYQFVYDNLNVTRRPTAILSSFFRWGVFFEDILPADEIGIFVVIKNTCGQSYVYEMLGHKARYVGEVNLEDLSRDYPYYHLMEHFEFAPFAAKGSKFCSYEVEVFPDLKYSDKFYSDKPWYYTAGVVCCFALTTMVFAVYDLLVQRRQNMVMAQAKKTTQIVNSLFPANVRERIMQEVQDDEQAKPSMKQAFLNTGKVTKLNDGLSSESIFGTKPIADLFPETTIMFGDLVGFTAWSSVREPTQVFNLLETLYHSFDVIAKRRRIFKVETVGDCYVAVTGLPMPRSDHAVAMCKFASDCQFKMKELVNMLDKTLGPDTSELAMRIGLHSGPVTAGVLRGEKGRFQLFGDTMNTASRMESTGKPGKIQISRDTAELLIAAGREKWITEREDQILAKGKGTMQTYWMRIQAGSCKSGSQLSSAGEAKLAQEMQKSIAIQDDEDHLKKTKGDTYASLSEKMQRLVDWNVDVLVKMLKQIEARRAASGSVKCMSKRELKKLHSADEGHTVLDEVQEILALPQFDAKVYQNTVDPNSITISEEATNQLTDYIAKICALYHENPFHNFEHASHVTMSVTKLLSRIISPIEVSTMERTDDEIAANLHDHTFGITSDPLTQFACVISALIHDADHPGVPNMVLVKEEDPLAAKYKGKSVAEQNSVDLAWDLLMSPEYKDLQNCIFHNKDEFERFRAIVVNVVMATDIMDKELGSQRKARWEQAFSGEKEEDAQVATNRKATIVLEHLMQASDVSHTMQHWAVYKKWNERLFRELYKAYRDGRTDTDPSKGWYQGEIGFFDFYIIPLAKKLETCGVFGVSSHEYLNYAQKNRQEWAEKGEELVREYLKNIDEDL